MKTIKYILLSAVLIGFTACNDEEDFDMTEEAVELPALTAGSANLSNYVALGNSLTAGFTDNALFIAGQQNSLPNTLSQQFALVGGGSFTQPLASDNVGGLILAGNPVLNPVTGERLFAPRLAFGGAGPVPLESLNPAAMSTTDFALNNPTGPFNNLGVPGALSFHLLANGYGNLANFPTAANPYAIRIAGNTDASILELAMAQSPSFFSLWIGNNDVLGYATSGGASGALTDQGTFDFAYGTLISTLTSQGAQGVVANIPDVTSIPFFTTVPHDPLDPSNPSFGPQIPTLNGIFGQINQVFAFLESQGIPNATDRQIVFSETAASPVVIRDESLMDLAAQITGVLNASPTFPAFVQSFGLPAAAAPQVAGLLGFVYGQARQATPDDLMVLPSSSIIGTVNEDFAAFLGTQGLPPTLAGQFAVEGVSLPLEDKWVLLPTEQAEIAQATSGFNATIAASASQAGLAFVDANALLNQLANGGLATGDFILTSSLVTGGAFSLDGVHPTARGYALLANEFMKAIDATYGSNFEASGNFVDVGEYPTNYSPALQ
ncbi:SGNH/GDSL hydrolase family protein [Psychroserpens luteolus]|uniref:G-D-S-L family lipolytic protein n=1 Tax=Psychroserpens luteolus TaxID=2855840 RepID=UPI001E39D7BF|nr:G-D-S-L family lipolytic protein [Psychroserpens luteolus]MCD2257995.1 G-D-S-L family lipolytic protein [Psychroserpens luteolus]